MRAIRVAVLGAVLLPFAAGAQPAQAISPYAGQAPRRIKSLSDEDVKGYLEGRGVGLALPAELNHYPGPRHVLDLADSLSLSPVQRRQIREIYDAMHARVIPLGREFVEVEAQLDAAFATRTMTSPRLGELLRQSADAMGALRRTHLDAHLRVLPLLTPEQVRHYDRLRGYDAGAAHDHSAHKP